ncbi:MAG: hypothetical protein AB8G05_01095 [Oligoflexales bacterium]
MRFQLVISLLVSLSTLGASAIAKEIKEAKQEIMYVQCEYVDLLNGEEDYQWAVDQNEAYVAVIGTKNAHNQFVTRQNEQLVKDFCTYTKRAQYGDDKSVFYEGTGMLASPSSFGKSIPLVFESETAYPANVDPDWAKNLKPGKVKPKYYNQLLAAKAVGVTVALAGLYFGYAQYGDKIFATLSKVAGTAIASFAVVDFVTDEAAGWDKAGKAIEKAEKASEKYRPKKPDEYKKLKKQWLESQLPASSLTKIEEDSDPK